METNQLLINYYKKEELKKAKNRQQEGMTIDEIIRLSNKEYITEQEIKEHLQYEDEDYEEQEENENISNNQETNVVDELDIIIEDDEEEHTLEIKNSEVIMIEDSKLEDYPNQPFKLYDEDKKIEMKESIRINGIMQPLIVRPIENGKYQILAGHNRRACAREIGLNMYPCIVKENLTEDEAMIYLVDTNLCTRDKISTMERARAYRIKYETYKRRNIETSMLEEVKKDNINIRGSFVKQEKASNGSIQRYLRLIHLIPKLQDIVDNNKMSINVGEKVSFLPNEEQEILARILSAKKLKLSENIVKKIRKAANNCREEDEDNFLSEEEILDLITAKTENVITGMTIIFSKEEVEQYFNKKTNEETKKYLLELLEKDNSI